MNPTNHELMQLVWTQFWQITVLIAAVAVAVRVFCRNRPHLAYVLWMLVVVKCLTPPLWSSPTGVFSWLQAAEVAPLETTASVTVAPADSMEFIPPEDLLAESELVEADSAAVEAWVPPSIGAVVGGVWLSGALLLAVVVAVKWIGLHLRLKRTTKRADPELADGAARLRERLGIRWQVRVLVTSEPIGLAVFGFFRPFVVLPQSLLEEVSTDVVHSILAHELVHVRRYDAPAGFLQAVAQLLWWFHPLVWWMNRQASRERERCCDEELVTGLECSPALYARSLLDVLELKRRLRSALSAPGIRPVEITSKRLENIMQRSEYFHHQTPRWCWGIVVLTSALVLPGAGITIEKNETFSREESTPEISTSPTEVAAVTQADMPWNNQPDTGRDEASATEAAAALKDLGANVGLDDHGDVVSVNFKLNSRITDAGLEHLKELTNLKKSGATFARSSVPKSVEPIVKSAAPSKDRTEYAVWLARWQAEQKAIVEIKKLGGSVKTEICAPPSLRKQLGKQRSRFVTLVNMMSRDDDKIERSVTNRNDSDQVLQYVKQFTQLKRLFLEGTQATDENLKHLTGLKKLQALYMWYASKVTDEGFAHLQKVGSLTYIHCSYSGITDDALVHLHPLKHLKVLDLVGNEFTDKALENVSEVTGITVLSIGAGHVQGVTDDGLVHLKKLTKLESLNLMATSVTGYEKPMSKLALLR